MGEKEVDDTLSDKFLFCFCKFLKSQEILIGLHGAVHAPGIPEVDPVGTPLQELYIFIDSKGILTAIGI